MLKIKDSKSPLIEHMKDSFVEKAHFNMFLDNRLLKDFKVATIRRGTTMTKVLKEYITKYINDDITK